MPWPRSPHQILRTLLFSRARQFERGALILVITSALSYAFGLLRDRALAGAFGASDLLDAYQAAFIIPDFLFNILIAAALSAAFIPVFTDLRTRGEQQTASHLAGSLLVIGLSVLLVVGIIAFAAAGALTRLVAPGFSGEQHALLTSLTRILLASPLLFLVSNLFGGMLVSTKRFLFYGISPALYNLGIIVGAVFFVPHMGIHGVAYGTLLGAVLHLLARAVDVYRSGLTLIPSVQISPAVRKVFLLMLPRMVGLTAVHMQLWAFTAIASTLGEGSVTVVNIARNFQSFPVSLIGIAFATSLFPLLVESASLRKRTVYTRRVVRGVLTTAAVALPAAGALFLVRTPMIAFFVGTGAFDPEAVARTAAVLGIYTLAIPTESLVHVLARGFYALHNTLIPVSVSLVSVGVSVSSSFLLAQRFGVVGIPAGFAIGTGLQFVLLATFLFFWSRRVFAAPPPPSPSD